ncbi:secretion protein HylD [Elizabethkingia meningoseptica]|uniref:HlyD family secretion protein n=3 Tax=Elizabethkingia meningoseptica TaxID=238 RepID=A0A1T3EZU4_ELIME|nr:MULTISPECIES: HlyD family efflux transporter periplasmic adaptor subunit [Elizabethkingia]AQX10967.1 secretion protein HylD [Elizabethkingia meningoseptica]MBG0512287.1 HlyD family efflux transporter periplasmic adaptor subunit [Elizabethkingia meningoseptica]MDE5430363.1 HlyD family secretion protein [Elizabethkingia meningoseptica]MDE5435592.1 HlyD family secretion protein [Elizabethkingia meningoseptica]MDE5450460.1 HlyD family secretion protein [Elizabethkingia meningoseptica]
MEVKTDILDEIELRSEGVQDILTRPPHWMIRWGNTLIFIILLLILFMSYIIKYPEFVPSQVIISSINPPEKLESRINSKIETLFVKDHQKVTKGQPLLILQSTAQYQDVLKLRDIVNSMESRQLQNFPLAETSGFKLGEVQGDYNAFAKALTDEQLYTRLQPYAPDNIAAEQSLSESRNRIQALQQQKRLEQAKYELSKKEFDRSQQLYGQGVISASELDQERIKLLQAGQSVENINLSISQLQEGVSGIQKTKSGVSINAQKDKVNFSSQTIQLFEQLRKSLNSWEQNYLFASSTDGSVSFQQYLGEHQFVKAGEVLITVMPDKPEALIGRLTVPSTNSGKIMEGQKVLIKLDNYPFQEFGIVEGRVRNMSSVPDKDGNYYVDVNLPKGLTTSFNKKLIFNKELKGNAEIVTKDLRLIERFFYQFRKLLGYQS